MRTDRRAAGLPNKGMKLTKPGELRSFAAYPRCSTDQRSGVAYFGCVHERSHRVTGSSRAFTAVLNWCGWAGGSRTLARAGESERLSNATRSGEAGSV